MEMNLLEDSIKKLNINKHYLELEKLEEGEYFLRNKYYKKSILIKVTSTAKRIGTTILDENFLLEYMEP